MSLSKYNEGIFKVYFSNPLYRQEIYEEQIDDVKSGKVVYITFDRKIKEKDIEEIQKTLNKFGKFQKFYRRKEGKTIYCEFFEQVNNHNHSNNLIFQ